MSANEHGDGQTDSEDVVDALRAEATLAATKAVAGCTICVAPGLGTGCFNAGFCYMYGAKLREPLPAQTAPESRSRDGAKGGTADGERE